MNLLPTSEDVKLLYRYVHYHNLMSSFGLRHWKREAAINDGSKIDFRGQVLEFKCRKTYYVSCCRQSRAWHYLSCHSYANPI